MEIVDHLLFNTLPDQPALSADAPQLNNRWLDTIPLHKHRVLKPGEFVVWRLTNQGLQTRAEQVDPSSLTPMFWLRDGTGNLRPYEFVDQTTADAFGIDNLELEKEVREVFSTSEIPSTHGVFALWGCYEQFLRKHHTTEEFLSSQKEELDELLVNCIPDKGAHGVIGDEEIQGFELAFDSRYAVFAEYNDKDTDRLFTLRKDDLTDYMRRFSGHKLNARGIYFSHAERRNTV